MKNNPRVSIIIPVYNGSKYLKEAVDSALSQTYNNLEIIVVNDGSNDNRLTEAAANKYGNKIRYFYKKNGGVASALNMGIREMTGDYFSWLSHDDAYFPNKIDAQIDYLFKQAKNDIILYSDYELIDHLGKHINNCLLETKKYMNIVLSMLLNRNINGCTLLIPKYMFDNIGLFNEELKTIQDYDMWFRMLKSGYIFKHLPMVLVKSRLHAEQGSKLMHDIQLAEKEKVFGNLLSHYTAGEICNHRDDYAICYLKLALAFKKENLRKISRYSLKIGVEHLKVFRIFHFIRGIIVLLFYVFWNKRLSVITARIKKKLLFSKRSY